MSSIHHSLQEYMAQSGRFSLAHCCMHGLVSGWGPGRRRRRWWLGSRWRVAGELSCRGSTTTGRGSNRVARNGASPSLDRLSSVISATCHLRLSQSPARRVGRRDRQDQSLQSEVVQHPKINFLCGAIVVHVQCHNCLHLLLLRGHPWRPDGGGCTSLINRLTVGQPSCASQ